MNSSYRQFVQIYTNSVMFPAKLCDIFTTYHYTELLLTSDFSLFKVEQGFDLLVHLRSYMEGELMSMMLRQHRKDFIVLVRKPLKLAACPWPLSTVIRDISCGVLQYSYNMSQQILIN